MATTDPTPSSSSSSKDPGYKGFGSFHSDNVEDLIRIPAAHYVPPALPSGLRPATLPDPVPAFGPAFRSLYFIDFDSWTFVNHGAFGGALRLSLDAAAGWAQYAESQPLRYFDRTLFPHMVASIRALAPLVAADPQDLVLLPNATTGLNAVLKSVVTPDLGPGSVYMLDIAYGSVKKMVDKLAGDAGLDVVRAPVKLSTLTSEDDIVELVSATLPSNAKLAVFDHITSNTGMVLPVKRLVKLCHDRGVPVLVDGAHALGSIPLDLSDIQPDYYVTNLHKWFCGCKGAALLYVRRDLQPTVRPVVISHGFGSGFVSEFIWDGCRDFSGMLAVPQIVAFWNKVGIDAARGYCQDLLKGAVQVLADAWGTGPLAPMAMYSHMALVEVPTGVTDALRTAVPTESEGCNSTHAKVLQDHLYASSVECPVKCLEGRLFVRISAAWYNHLEDYTKLAEAALGYASST